MFACSRFEKFRYMETRYYSKFLNGWYQFFLEHEGYDANNLRSFFTWADTSHSVF